MRTKQELQTVLQNKARQCGVGNHNTIYCRFWVCTFRFRTDFAFAYVDHVLDAHGKLHNSRGSPPGFAAPRTISTVPSTLLLRHRGL